MRKILVIGGVDIIGGAARVGWDIAAYLPKDKYSIKFIVGRKMSNSKDVYELKRNPFLKKVDSLTGKNISGLSRQFSSFILANDIDRGASEEILGHHWYKEADLVHCHNLHGNFFRLDTLSKMANEKPVVWTLHDMWAITSHCAHCYECKNFNNGRHFTTGFGRYGSILWNNSEYLWNKKKSVYRKSKKLNIVVPSLWLEQKVKSSILKRKPLTIINNGVDINIFKPRNKNKIRNELKLPLKKKIIIYVGQGGALDPRKGGQFFLQVASRLVTEKEIDLLCIGGTIERKPVRKGNIIYTPQIKDKETMSKYYSLADILLFPSLAENFPLVTLEALASGLPIVSFDVGGVKEQVKHRLNGYIARYKNTKDLIKGVKFILELDKKDLERMENRNRHKAVKRYSLSNMAKKYLDLYEKII